jgi:hypothetical protein
VAEKMGTNDGQGIGGLNMPDDKLARLLRRFAAAATAHHQAMEAMNEKGAATHARVISGLYGSIIGEGEAGRAALLALVDDANPVVAGMAAVYSIHYNSERCLAVLSRIALESGLLGFRAGAAVERWKRGEWSSPEDD